MPPSRLFVQSCNMFLSLFLQSLSAAEALGVYIEMLLLVLTDSDYRDKHCEYTSRALRVGVSLSEQERICIRNHLRASRTVENLICTSRESLLGSSVWKGEFFQELTTRPFHDVRLDRSGTLHDASCSMDHADERGREKGLERCDACGRENKSSMGYKVSSVMISSLL